MHVGHIGYIPTRNVCIEVDVSCRAIKFTSEEHNHIRNSTHVPVFNWAIKGGRLSFIFVPQVNCTVDVVIVNSTRSGPR